MLKIIIFTLLFEEVISEYIYYLKTMNIKLNVDYIIKILSSRKLYNEMSANSVGLIMEKYSFSMEGMLRMRCGPLWGTLRAAAPHKAPREVP